jgi:hypothetical protein
LVYIAAVFLLFIVLPNKQIAILFAMFFGLYSILKSLLDRIKNIYISYTLRFIIMNLLLFLGLFAVVKLFGNRNLLTHFDNRNYLLILIFIAIQFLFLAYDFGLSFSVKFIRKYIKD